MVNQRKEIAVVGFYGTGSSAVIDLLREFDNCGVALDRDAKGRLRPYEHFPFVSSGGLFEMGALLTNVNSAYSSDMIFNNFIDCTKRLNDNNFVSFGSYKWLLGDKFMSATDEFLKELGMIEVAGATSEHKVKTRFSLIMVFLQFAAKIVFKRPVYRWGKKNITDKKPTLFGMPSEQTYYTAARKYIKAYLDMCSQEGKDFMIYDQLIAPQNIDFVDKYFDDNFRAILVVRDARDIYSLSKYYWSKPPMGFSPPLPVDIDKFAYYWSQNVKVHKNSDKVMILQFEDLVYNYEKTLKEIIEFIGLNEKNHIHKKDFFDPAKSIKNTQTFLLSDEKKMEAEKVAQMLPDSLYEFPYEIKTSYNEMFDDSKEVNDKKIYKR